MTETIERDQAVAALRLMVEWGADEALAAVPIDRFAATATPARPPPAIAPTLVTAREPPALPKPAGSLPTPMHQAEAIAAAAGSIADLRAALASFEGCGLRATAGNLVFADGNPEAGLVLVGEAPGAEEDREGKPFVGASGRLLDKMLGSIGLDRTQCLITNIIPWRPPGNRNPTDSEILVCLPFLHRHLALLRPRRVVVLGATAARALTGSSEGIRKLRGRWLEVSIPGLDQPLRVLPMLHPAYLLRQPGAKREAWSDLITLKTALDAPLNELE